MGRARLSRRTSRDVGAGRVPDHALVRRHVSCQHPEVVEECVDVFLRNDVQAHVETCKMLGADLRAALPRMTMPTAVVVGGGDYATPVAMAEAMHRTIEGSTLTILAGARHLTPFEAPDRIGDESSALMERAKKR